MHKILVASVAVLALAVSPALAQDNDDDEAIVGGAAGGITGSIAGGIVFGPIGAIIGGFTGAVIGSSVVSDASVDYARLNPVEPVAIEGDIDIGYVVPDQIEVAVVAEDPDYGYFYTEDRLWFVELDTRTVVYSPGVVVAAEGEVE